MKLVLIAPGYKPFPPNGWGAVESIVWDYYENLKKKNVDVVIVNTANPHLIIQETNSHRPTVVHIMYDDYIGVVPYLQCPRIFYTSHYAYITHPEFETRYSSYFHGFFKTAILNQARITMNLISTDLANVYRKHGFQGKINILSNGAREDLFLWRETPKYPEKSIYLAKVEYRKGQYKYQAIENIDFVGNYHDSPFDIRRTNYLGEWNKSTLYTNLTDYANLVLLSSGEADPLVVKEALIAGLGVVLSECSCANLDTSLPFITIVPNEKLEDMEYVKTAIVKNRKTSLANREQIREYGLTRFSWNTIIDEYLTLIS
jgi:glycosyltransferase involved in cell wall biosynthesis